MIKKTLCLFLLVAGMLVIWAVFIRHPSTHHPANNPEAENLVKKAQQLINERPAKLAEADAILAKAAELDPQNVHVYGTWADLYERQQNWAKAEEKYKKLLEAQWLPYDPYKYRMYGHLASLATTQKHFAESNAYLAQAPQKDRGMLETACTNYVYLKKWPEAISECSKAIEYAEKIKPPQFEQYAYTMRAYAYAMAGEKDKAARDQQILNTGKVPQ